MELPRIIRHYGIRHRQRKQAELDWFRSQPSLEAAVECAALAVDSRGKRFSHQRRIRRGALPEARAVLSAAIPRLRRCRDFAGLINLVDAVLEPIAGVNEMYVYDTALADRGQTRSLADQGLSASRDARRSRKLKDAVGNRQQPQNVDQPD